MKREIVAAIISCPLIALVPGQSQSGAEEGESEIPRLGHWARWAGWGLSLGLRPLPEVSLCQQLPCSPAPLPWPSLSLRPSRSIGTHSTTTHYLIHHHLHFFFPFLSFLLCFYLGFHHADPIHISIPVDSLVEFPPSSRSGHQPNQQD